MAECSPEELHISLGRHDERIKAIVSLVERSERDRDRAIKLASDELARRLDILNHSHEQARETLATYLPRETHERDIKHLEKRLRETEDALRDLTGKLWLPMLALAGIAAGLATAVVIGFVRR